ncbi:MAG: serine/threonine protein phosphatase [Deltaproteobacteria bacterium]|nr:serine/threonine protein phosphatase [Deltaproteobacteria bacterium]
MAGRTIAIGDVHGEDEHLERIWSRLPPLDRDDTVVFLGDYIDRGRGSRIVLERLMRWHERSCAKLVFLRGNHEAGWLKVVDGGGWPGFVLPPNNGCWQTAVAYGVPLASEDEPGRAFYAALLAGSFFPAEHLAWMRKLDWYYEDRHAIYVHAGLPKIDGRFVHPAEELGHPDLVWQRDLEFFRDYRGKRVVCGHTATAQLPQELSTHTPDDPTDTWIHGDVIVVDTKCGKRDGYLSAVELPGLRIYESR